MKELGLQIGSGSDDEKRRQTDEVVGNLVTDTRSDFSSTMS